MRRIIRTPKKWSILILFEEKNKNDFNYIYKKLSYLINKEKLNNDIEILYLINKDDNINREKLINQSRGEWISFINVKYDISDNYIKEIFNNLNTDYIKFQTHFTNKNQSLILDNDYIYPIKKSLIPKNFDYQSLKIHNFKILENVFIFKNEEYKDVKITNDINKDISIIITAYNSQDFIEECLNSVQNQTYFQYNNYEILVGVDGCETTYNKLNQIKNNYNNLKIYMMENNQGTYITTNTLINLVKYENVIRFDSDDVMFPNLVEEVMKIKDDYDIIKINYDGIIYFKKSIMDNVLGGYQPWRVAADTEILKRSISAKLKIGKINNKVFNRRNHANSLTNSKETGSSSKLRQIYISKIKSKFQEHEIKIDRVINEIKHDDKQLKLSYIGILIVNYNNLNYTRDCVNDLFNQINKRFYLWVVDQNSTELGTIEYLKEIESKGVNVIYNSTNVDLNRVWNNFYNICNLDYLCFLNNDTRLSNNFTDDVINIFEKELSVGIVIHVTNNLKFTKNQLNLNYEILSPPLTQGWDFTIKRSIYHKIPDSLRIFGGDDFIFGNVVKNGYKIAFSYSSPIIHYKEKTRKKLKEINDIHKSDIKNFHIEKNKYKFDIIHPTYSTNKSNKYSPEGIELTQNKKCIFTSLIGDYDNLTIAKEKQIDWDYICFTDDKNLKSDFWKIIHIEKTDNTVLGEHKLARYIKTNYFEYLSSYDILLWKDCRIIINCDLNEYLKLLNNNDILFMKHPESNSILDEFNNVLSLNLESNDIIEKIKLKYSKNGYNYDNGLIASGIMLFKNNERVINFFKIWWNEIKELSHRDQLSANYAIFKSPNLIYNMIPQQNIISPNKYFLRGYRKKPRFKKL